MFWDMQQKDMQAKLSNAEASVATKAKLIEELQKCNLNLNDNVRDLKQAQADDLKTYEDQFDILIEEKVKLEEQILQDGCSRARETEDSAAKLKASEDKLCQANTLVKNLQRDLSAAKASTRVEQREAQDRITMLKKELSKVRRDFQADLNKANDRIRTLDGDVVHHMEELKKVVDKTAVMADDIQSKEVIIAGLDDGVLDTRQAQEAQQNFVDLQSKYLDLYNVFKAKELELATEQDCVKELQDTRQVIPDDFCNIARHTMLEEQVKDLLDKRACLKAELTTLRSGLSQRQPPQQPSTQPPVQPASQPAETTSAPRRLMEAELFQASRDCLRQADPVMRNVMDAIDSRTGSNATVPPVPSQTFTIPSLPSGVGDGQESFPRRGNINGDSSGGNLGDW
jgi:hypothetical protein